MSEVLAEPAFSPGANSTIGATAGSRIDRAGYVALRSPDPAKAAAFANDVMGFTEVHADDEGRHYLAAAGPDPYSLVYTPGEERGIDHICYFVPDLEALNAEEARLRELTEVKRIEDNPLWRGASAIAVTAPAGHEIRLTPGIPAQIPLGFSVVPKREAPAPISADHFAIMTEDIEADVAFARDVLGLKETARVAAPDAPVIVFFRAHTLFHCYTLVRGQRNGAHHMQFTIKNQPAIHASYAALKDQAEMVWGPVRHGPGHNVAFYFRDGDGTFIEYSAEEEIILDDAGYLVQEWSVEDPRFADEWGTPPPPVFLE